MRANKGCLFRAWCSGGVPFYHLNLTATESKQRHGKALRWKRGKASNVRRLEAAGGGRLQVGEPEVGHLCHWLGVHVWFSLVGPKLEAGVRIRGAVSYESSSGHMGSIAAGVPGLLAGRVV